MIHINLLGEKVDRSSAYVVQLLAFFGAITVSLVGCFLLYNSAANELATLKDDIIRSEQELKKLEKQTAEVKDLEQKEKLLREKLATIAQLKSKKHGPVHVLADMSTAVPEKSWLEGLKEREGILELKGIALDNQTIALFMRDLDNSKYFGNVDLIQSKQYVKDNVKMKEFAISLRLENPITQLLQNQLPSGSTVAEEGNDSRKESKVRGADVSLDTKKLRKEK